MAGHPRCVLPLLVLALTVRGTAAADEPKPRAVLAGHMDEVCALAFSPDGKTLATAGQDASIRLWDVGTAKERLVINGGADNKDRQKTVKALAFSPDGKAIASSGTDPVVRLWDAATGEPTHALEGHKLQVVALAYSPDGKSLASGEWNRKVIFWDPATGKARRELATSRVVECLAFHPAGATLAVGHAGYVEVWDAETGKPTRVFSHPEARDRLSTDTLALAFSPDGKALACGTHRKSIRILNAESGQERATLPAHDEWVVAVEFSPDGATLAAANGDGVLQLWDVGKGRVRATVRADKGYLYRLAFSPDGRTIATGGSGGKVHLWDVAGLLKPGK